MENSKAIDMLLGVALGDALGVPYEFRSRWQMKQEPARGMVGHGTWDQPEGTWSDDSSLTFCLAEALLGGYDLAHMAQRFVMWRYENHWTARGEVFDVGGTTSRGILSLRRLLAEGDMDGLTQLKYQGEESENGNGSLMRILPLLLPIRGLPVAEQFVMVWDVSALTHRHIRAAMACMVYLRLAGRLLDGEPKAEAYAATRQDILGLWEEIGFPMDERNHFARIIGGDIRDVPEESLSSEGYVIDSLETAVRAFLLEDSYRDTVLAVIDLGGDTDTGAAIAGGLAGILYGRQGMPEEWLSSLARLEDIVELGRKLGERYGV